MGVDGRSDGSKSSWGFVLSVIALGLLTAFCHPHPGFACLGHRFAWPIIFTIGLGLWCAFVDWRSWQLAKRKAASLGGIPIPRVKGRWPLNVDIVVKWAKWTQDEVGRMLVELERVNGKTYNTRMLLEDQIVTSDPAVLRHVLLNSDNFIKGTLGGFSPRWTYADRQGAKFKHRTQGFLGDGIFNSDGPVWRTHRTLLRPFFQPQYISADLFRPAIARFFADLSHTFTDGQHVGAFDMQARINDLTLNLALLWLTGEDIGEDPDSRRNAIWRQARDALPGAVKRAQEVVSFRLKVGWPWQIIEAFRDPLREPMRVIRAFFRPVLDDAYVRAAQDDSKPACMLDRLVREPGVARQLVEDELVNILLAARDTTTVLVTVCTYMLALHPEVMLRASQAVESDSQGSTLQAVISEVLRLFPPVPINTRRAAKDCLLPTEQGPMFMAKGTTIILDIINMQRSTELWGDDAMDFLPERWLPPDTGHGTPSSDGYIPWSIGPRTCLGKNMAMTVTTTFLGHLLDFLHDENLSLTLVPDAAPLDSIMPDWWKENGDGRARHGQERIWVTSDMTLTVKARLSI